MIVLDHAAFTPVDPAAWAAMQALIGDAIGNPLAAHAAGRRSAAALEQARVEVATYLGGEARELEFWPSATAALAAIIPRVLDSVAGPIVSVGLEHTAVSEPLDVHARGRELSRLPRPGGLLELDASARELADAAVLIVAPLDHELGVRVALEGLRARVREDCWWVVDAAQAAVWMELDAIPRARSYVIAAGPKLGGPPGIAAVLGPTDSVATLRCPGTPAWLGAIGMGAACRVRARGRGEALARAAGLGHRLRTGLLDAAPGSVANVHADADWLGPIVNIAHPQIDGLTLAAAMDREGVCIARGAACMRRIPEGSPAVASAWPEAPWRARNASRWSLGWGTDEHAVDEALAAFRRVFARLLEPT